MAYTKFHDAWLATDELSGEAWNYLETQWSAIQSDADAHNHDTRYYTKTLADTTFFSLTYFTNFDCDLLDGQHFSDILAAVMPLGAIMMWSGTDATIPTGWHISDGGTYGGKASPDLRDRFVIGAGGDYAVNATGGPATHNGNITPTGTVAVGNHVLTTGELPAHTHTYSEDINSWTVDADYNSSYTLSNYHSNTTASTSIDEQVSGGEAHGHTGSTVSFTAIDPRPLYYSLYYIIKYA